MAKAVAKKKVKVKEEEKTVLKIPPPPTYLETLKLKLGSVMPFTVSFHPKYIWVAMKIIFRKVVRFDRYTTLSLDVDDTAWSEFTQRAKQMGLTPDELFIHIFKHNTYEKVKNV